MAISKSGKKTLSRYGILLASLHEIPALAQNPSNERLLPTHSEIKKLADDKKDAQNGALAQNVAVFAISLLIVVVVAVFMIKTRKKK